MPSFKHIDYLMIALSLYGMLLGYTEIDGPFLILPNYLQVLVVLLHLKFLWYCFTSSSRVYWVQNSKVQKVYALL